VVISGSRDYTVRVWDLATGTPIGGPFTGHTDWVQSVAAAELDGRPVVISGSGDRTLRVWDLATGRLIGDPFTGHTSRVNTVAAAELDGRPVAISGSDDYTVRVWDLATGTSAGNPLAWRTGKVGPSAVRNPSNSLPEGAFGQASAGVGNTAAILSVGPLGIDTSQSHQVYTLELGSNVLSLAWAHSRALVTGTELGIVVFDFLNH
jgi:WD40 repeat protein